MEIKAEVKSISKLKDYFFVVPDYQREYVWKPDDQVEQFIIDVDNEYEPNDSIQKSYFLGSIIIVENNSKFDVIDGQQRLTTIVLALCAFRDILSTLDLDEKLGEYLKAIEKLLSDFDINTDQSKLRLELQYDESKDFLTYLIQRKEYKDVITPSIKKMSQAHDKLKSHFEIYLKQDVQSLTSYVRYFLTKIELVVIESENLSSALKIFETINQRGAGLNAMDLVKNLLFSEADEKDFQKIKDTWKEIISNLQKCNEEGSPLRFLRYFLMARYHEGVIREDDIYKWIISPEGKDSTNYIAEPLNFAKELKQISERYARLVLATERLQDGGDFPSVTNIGFVNKYKSRQHLILLLALDTTAPDEVLEYLGDQIESFFFYSNSLGIQAKRNEMYFAKWAKGLRGNRSIDEVRHVLDSTMLPYIASKASQFKNEFLNLNHWAYNPLYRLRYVFGKIENKVLAKTGLSQKNHAFFNSLQIEHIFLQSPKDGYIPPEFSDVDEYKSIVYKLGNVTLLEGTINQAVNNFNDLASDWYNKKIDEYERSNVVSTNLLHPSYSIGKNTAINKFKSDYLYLFPSWDKKSVVNRQKILLELVFETWRINGKRVDKIETLIQMK